MTSPDGTTWTARTGVTTNTWAAIAWNGTVFAAVSGNGTAQIMTSPDGTTWTGRTTPSSPGASVTNNQWEGIAWNGNMFAAISSNGLGNNIMTSPDGTTWTIRTTVVNNSQIGIAWNGLGTGTTLLTPAAGTGTVFAVVGYGGTGDRVMTSLFLKDE
jgi:hypothetical protein